MIQNLSDRFTDKVRLEKAMEQPASLAQETIVDNLDPKEAARLDKVRNIGIAVREAYLRLPRSLAPVVLTMSL